MLTVPLPKPKLTAIAETGYEAIPYASVVDGCAAKLSAHTISYVLVWRNHGYNEWTNACITMRLTKDMYQKKDFIKFYNDERTLFEKDAAKENLYQQH